MCLCVKWLLATIIKLKPFLDKFCESKFDFSEKNHSKKIRNNRFQTACMCVRVCMYLRVVVNVLVQSWWLKREQERPTTLAETCMEKR